MTRRVSIGNELTGKAGKAGKAVPAHPQNTVQLCVKIEPYVKIEPCVIKASKIAQFMGANEMCIELSIRKFHS